jgi:hypothetical protein
MIKKKANAKGPLIITLWWHDNKASNNSKEHPPME